MSLIPVAFPATPGTVAVAGPAAGCATLSHAIASIETRDTGLVLTAADTAYSIAAVRAEESKRPAHERLFEDPYATLFYAAGAHAEREPSASSRSRSFATGSGCAPASSTTC